MNFLGMLYQQIGEYALAEEYKRKVLSLGFLDTDVSVPWGWGRFISILINQGKFEEAEKTLEQWEKKNSNSSLVTHSRVDLSCAKGDFHRAVKYTEKWRKQTNGSLYQHIVTIDHLALIAINQGKLEEAASQYRNALAMDEDWEFPTLYQRNALRLALTQLWLNNDTTLARKTLDSALARHPLDSVNTLNREYHRLANAFARLGQSTRARTLLVEARDSIPPDMQGRFKYELYRARGRIAVAEGRLEDAAAQFERLEERPTWVNQIDNLFALGLIHDRLGKPDSAIANYERLVAQPFKGWWRAGWYQPRALERLGQLYEEQGETQKAIHYYNRFIELWKDCDPELRPRVEAAREALVRLTSLTEG